ncbi:MAG: hypothetical protein AAFU78_21175 [Cyanobacteria bacterium J06633_2]
MQTQLTRKRIINTLLIGTIALGIGSLTIQPAEAQLSRSSFREMARELDLSRSQMRDVAGIMRDFRSEIEDILTPEQFDLLQSTREERQSQTQTQNRQEFRDDLDLTDTQSAQLADVRQEMVDDLQEILEPDQLERIMEMTAFSRF